MFNYNLTCRVNDMVFVFVIFMNNFAVRKTNVIHYGVKNKRYM